MSPQLLPKSNPYIGNGKVMSHYTGNGKCHGNDVMMMSQVNNAQDEAGPLGILKSTQPRVLCVKVCTVGIAGTHSEHQK